MLTTRKTRRIAIRTFCAAAALGWAAARPAAAAPTPAPDPFASRLGSSAKSSQAVAPPAARNATPAQPLPFVPKTAVTSAAPAPSQAHGATIHLPPRPADARTGSEFYRSCADVSFEPGKAERERRVFQEVVAGNIPDFLRTFVPVTVQATIDGTAHTATYHVSPDYLAIGSDADHFRIPLSGTMAQQIADHLGCSLITRKVSNDIYNAATVKLEPAPFNPKDYVIHSLDVMYMSNQRIAKARAEDPAPLGALVAGHKKDVVVTARLGQPMKPPPRVAIYGWHQRTGKAIQPLSLVHEVTYHDYSHGIRLLKQEMTINGKPYRVSDVLQDAKLHVLLSDEGAFNSVRYATPVAPPAASAPPNPGS